MQIYLVENGKPVGPFELEEIRSRLIQGDLDWTDYGWHEGLADWVALSDIKGLKMPPPAPKVPQATIAKPQRVMAPTLETELADEDEDEEELSPVKPKKKGLSWWALALVVGVLFVFILITAILTHKYLNQSTGVLEPGESSSSEELSSSSELLGANQSAMSSVSSSAEAMSSAETQELVSTLSGKTSIAQRSGPPWLRTLTVTQNEQGGLTETISGRRYHYVDLDGDGVNEVLVFVQSSDAQLYVYAFRRVNGQYQYTNQINLGEKSTIKYDTIYPTQNKIAYRTVQSMDSDTGKVQEWGQQAFKYTPEALDVTTAPKIPTPKVAPKAAAKSVSSSSK